MARSPKKHTVEHASPEIARANAYAGPTRGALIIACLVLCALVTFAYAGSAWASVLYRLLTDGVLLVVWLACAAGLGGALLVALPLSRKDSEHEERFLHVVTAIALGLGFYSLATLGLGLAGWLNRATAFGVLAVGAISGFVIVFNSARSGAPPGDFDELDSTELIEVSRIAQRSGAPDPPAASPDLNALHAWFRAAAGWSWLWLAAMPFLAIAIVTSLVPPGVMWPGEPHGYDVVEYHLQIPREWYELGRIVPLHHNAFSFFPFNVEMHYLLAMHLRAGAWAGMYLAHFMHLAMIALTVAAVYGFTRPLTRSGSSATIAAVATATVPWMTQLGSIAYNEGGLLLFGTLAMGWAFRAAISPARRLGRFPVAGLLAGFACGSKLTAVPEVLIAVGGISLLVVLLTHRTTRSDVPLSLRLGGLASFFLAAMLTFAPWLIRNQFWAGNPVFPEAAGLLGQAHFSDGQVERWKQAHSPRPDQRSISDRLSAWYDDVWKSWQYGYLHTPLGLCAAVLVWLRTSRPDVPRNSNILKNTGTGSSDAATAKDYSNVLENMRISLAAFVGVFTALSVVWLGFTHLQGRFFILAVPIAGLLIGHVAWGRMTPLAAGVVLVAAVLGYGRLHAVVAERVIERELNQILGFENLSEAFTPPAFAEIPSDVPLALAGDARAFVYPGPMSRLHYRTVFDVDAKAGESVIDAWTRGAPPGAWVLVDPNELRRFYNTYRSIPSLPPEYENRTEPFVIAPVARIAP